MESLIRIYEELLDYFREWRAGAQRDSLMSGDWGALLFLFYYEHYCDTAQERATEILGMLYDSLNEEGDTNYSICNGLTGPFWMLRHLNEQGFIELDMDDLAADFIGAAIKESETFLEQGNFDFLHGSPGICLFLTGFSTRPEVRAHLEAFAGNLSKRSVDTGQGLSLPVYGYGKAGGNDGIDALSLAHGSCGLQVVLSKIHAAGIAQETCRRLVYGNMERVLRSRNSFPGNLPHVSQSVYPNTLDGKYPWSRVAWCYGDLSVALALWQCGAYWNETRWKEEALCIVQHNTRRLEKEHSGIQDPGFCHGSAGAALIFRKFWQETGTPAFLDCSEYWYHKTLMEIKDAAGNKGMKAKVGDDSWNYYWDLLNGSAGVGLALLSREQEKPLSWHQCFLID